MTSRPPVSVAGVGLDGAALRDDTEDVRGLVLRRCGIAIGSEGRGLSQELLELCGSIQRPLRFSMRYAGVRKTVSGFFRQAWQYYRKRH